MRPFVTGMILAAGSSTRMGSPKQLLPIGGKPILQHVLDAAADSRLSEIVVVLGHHAAEIERAIRRADDGRLQTVLNDRHEHGQSTSLQAGLHAADSRAVAVAVLLGDQPGVSAELIDRVLSAFAATGRNVVRPVWHSSSLAPPGLASPTPGHPVILARSIWGELQTLRGDEGARTLIAAHPEWLHEVVIEGEAPRDIDTPQDYRSVR